MDLRKEEWDAVDWNNLNQNRHQWRAVDKTLTGFQLHKKDSTPWRYLIDSLQQIFN
jgi:hypothetical protein